MRQIYLYCLATTAATHGIDVHAVTLMSTHEHLVVTDREGRLPEFLHALHRVVALCVKTLRGWEGTVWDPGRTSVVELKTPQAVLEKLTYVMANPVEAELVHHVADWPGPRTLPSELGRARFEVDRPALYFDPANTAWPRAATLALVMPHVRGMSDDDVRSTVLRRLLAIEASVARRLRATRGVVVGRKACVTASPFRRARRPDPPHDRNPTLAVGLGMRQAWLAAIRATRAFRRAYAEALDRWRAGVRDVEFPNGTWLMRVLHRVAVSA